MSECKFKPGDEVLCDGRVHIVQSIPGMPEYDSRGFGRADEGLLLDDGYWDFQYKCTLVKPAEEFLFKIGDVVRCKTGEVMNYFDGTAIFRGQSEDSPFCVALEREDGKEGLAQNGWWNFRKENLDKLELVESTSGNSFQYADFLPPTVTISPGDIITTTPFPQHDTTIPEAEEVDECDEPQIKVEQSYIRGDNRL